MTRAARIKRSSVTQVWNAIYVLHAFRRRQGRESQLPIGNWILVRQRLIFARKLAGKWGDHHGKSKFTASSGNVFADLKLPHADDLLAKAELAAKIIEEIQRRRLTQTEAAKILGIDQPKISALKQGKLSGFSIERLMRLLLALGPISKSPSKADLLPTPPPGFALPKTGKGHQLPTIQTASISKLRANL